MDFTPEYSVVGLRKAEQVTMRPVKPAPKEVKVDFFPEEPKPPPAPTHDPKFTKRNQEGPYKSPEGSDQGEKPDSDLQSPVQNVPLPQQKTQARR